MTPSHCHGLSPLACRLSSMVSTFVRTAEGLKIDARSSMVNFTTTTIHAHRPRPCEVHAAHLVYLLLTFRATLSIGDPFQGDGGFADCSCSDALVGDSVVERSAVVFDVVHGRCRIAGTIRFIPVVLFPKFDNPCEVAAQGNDNATADEQQGVCGAVPAAREYARELITGERRHGRRCCYSADNLHR